MIHPVEDNIIFTATEDYLLDHIDSKTHRIQITPPFQVLKDETYSIIVLANQTIEIWRLIATGTKGEIQ